MLQPPDVPSLSRRTWLASAAASAMAPSIAIGRDDAEDREIDTIREKAKSAGLGEFGVSRNEQYLAIGDAPEGFRKKALEILNGLAKDYFKHMTEKGFKVEKPPERMRLLV